MHLNVNRKLYYNFSIYKNIFKLFIVYFLNKKYIYVLSIENALRKVYNKYDLKTIKKFK